VNWQNKYPTNGREFTAYDVEYHYDRHMGTGQGFTKPSPYSASLLQTIKKVTALDKYTVQFEFVRPGAMNFTSAADFVSRNIMEAANASRYPGPKTGITGQVPGPWILSEYVPSSIVILTKNPNYCATTNDTQKISFPMLTLLKFSTYRKSPQGLRHYALARLIFRLRLT